MRNLRLRHVFGISQTRIRSVKHGYKTRKEGIRMLLGLEVPFKRFYGSINTKHLYDTLSIKLRMEAREL
jgi:uncharacterized protein YbcI